jgi:hypothetical protein
MRIKLTIVLLFFLKIHSYSQIWSPNGAKWHHSFFGGNVGFITTKYEKDTIVNGENCKLLLQLHNDLIPFDKIFTKELDSVVYVYNDQSFVFDTLFNFKSNIGSSWNIPGYSSAVCGAEGKVIVTEKGFRSINGLDLMWLKINVQFDPLGNNSLWDYSDTIYQRFGTVSAYFMPYSFCENNLELESIGNLRCYQDNSFSNFNITNHSCDYIPSNGIISIEDRYFTIYSDTKCLRINCSDSNVINDCEIKIMDMNGFVFFQTNDYNIRDNTIPIENFPTGTYIITINNLINLKFIRI